MSDHDVVQLILSLVINISGTGFLTWLVRDYISEKLKNSIKSEYDHKLATHEAQLKAQSDVEIERLRSQLNLVAKEHDVVFSRLHQGRVDAVSDIHAKLNRAYLCLSEYVNPIEMSGDSSKDRRFDELHQAYNAFENSYNEKSIFLPAAIDDKINAIQKMIVQNSNQFTHLVRNQELQDRYKFWAEIEESCSGPIKGTLADLKSEFRLLLGDKAGLP